MSELDFGDYCTIKQKRHGAENVHYVYKVIGRLSSNSYVDVPVQTPEENVKHSEVVPVLRCICCGVWEETVSRFRVEDCKPLLNEQNHSSEEYV